MSSKYFYNSKNGKLTLRKSDKRGYTAVTSQQLQEGWTASLSSAHTELRGGLSRLRNMTRDLERSNPYVVRFLNEWVTNIVGSGYTFQSLATNAAGREDVQARSIIEEAWEEWKKPRNCTASKDMSYCEFKSLTERSIARDGGILIQKLRGFDNEYNFALRVLEIDRLDLDYNVTATGNGNRIVMGKELNVYDEPIAYHLLGDHPGETYKSYGKKRTRVPADQIIHRFYRNRAEASHADPLITSAIVQLRHLEKYEEAESIAARISASSTVAIERDSSMPYEGDEYYDQELSPGGKWELEPGEKATLLNPTHPNANYDGFRSGVLKGVSAGLLMSYPTLAQDYGGVNYSSLRESKLNIKALTKCYRRLNIENEEEPIFRAWLGTAMRTGAIKLPASNFANFAKSSFTGAGFEWVDPAREISALKTELEIGATSLSRAVKERLGVSLDVIIAERKRDAEAFEKAGLPVPIEINPNPISIQSGNADMPSVEGLLNVKEQADTYGVGVRAGMITAQKTDEENFREKAGLPEMSPEAEDAWKEDGGIRRPVTLQSQTAFEAAQEDIEKE
jgi:lambda family phage portal protein